MRRVRQVLPTTLLALALSLLASAPAIAQGVTSAAVSGTISREGGGPIEGAVVQITNTATGARMQMATGASGRYLFENVQVGGPYTLQARAIGFEATTKTGIMLTLGQRLIENFTLRASVVTLQELAVEGAVNPLINANRTGPAQMISDTAISRLPLLGRNFTSLLNVSPQVSPTSTGGLSIGGQNNRFNTIQIDGGVNNDVFGLAASGTPGGGAGAKPLSIEALKEFQILVAPFDVRQGSFSGGLVNGVTKSGTNTWSGSLFGYTQRPSLVGKDTAGAEVADFDIKQYGGTLGGPIIRDRLHFFAAADLQSSATPFTGNNVSDPTIGITQATIDRVRNALINRYGFDPGGSDEPIIQRPDKNFFGKLSWTVNNGLVELSHNYVDAGDDNLNRTTLDRIDRDGFILSNSGYTFASTTNSTRLKYTGLVGRASVDVLLGRQTVRDAREIPNRVPQIMVQDAPNRYIAAGGERFSHANSLDQDIYELTANVTFGLGNHRLTVGTHNEFFSFVNVFFEGSLGVWTFNNVADLEAATPAPSRYLRNIEVRPGGAVADFGVRQFGGYLQDQWNPTDRLALTLGLRFDVPFSDKPVTNPALQANPSFGFNTGDFPSGNVLISPRFGFNYDLRGDNATVLRGGAGIFSGRPPYVWMANAFTNTGVERVTITCTGAGVPTFTVDPENQPGSCANAGVPQPPAAAVNYFVPDFKFQQALKFSLGLDHRLPWSMVGTLDFLHTRGRNQMYLTDANRVPGAVNTEGRQLYTRVSTAFTQVIVHENRNGDQSTSLTAQLQKSFSDGLSFSAAYTWAKSEDLMTFTSSTASSNLTNTTLDGTHADRNLRTSAFDVPHRLKLSGTANLPLGFVASVIYSGRSGSPYAYNISGDANGDGLSNNDLFYVPASAGEISLANPADYARLDAFIEQEECLRSQRGRIMERNSCRNPWQSFIDVRLGKVFETIGNQRLEVTADVFNFLNLINGDWGLVRQTNTFEQRSLLNLSGTDNVNGRPIYSVPGALPSREQVQIGPSRWRVQLGARYAW